MYGVRYLRLLDHTSVVSPLRDKVVWDGSTMKAICDGGLALTNSPKTIFGFPIMLEGIELHTEPAPAYDCGCGMYAFNTLTVLESQPCNMLDHSDFCAVLVEARGNVVIHEFGFRSEYMRPVATVCPTKMRTSDGFWGAMKIQKTDVPGVFKATMEERTNDKMTLILVASEMAQLLRVGIMPPDSANIYLGMNNA